VDHRAEEGPVEVLQVPQVDPVEADDSVVVRRHPGLARRLLKSLPEEQPERPGRHRRFDRIVGQVGRAVHLVTGHRGRLVSGIPPVDAHRPSQSHSADARTSFTGLIDSVFD